MTAKVRNRTMAVVTVILGLCGSGKSTLAAEFAARGFLRFDEGVVPGFPNWEPFLEAARAGLDCVVVEVAYLSNAGREFLAQTVGQANPGSRIDYVCFENDVTVANANCVARARRDATRDAEGNCRQNEHMAQMYTYPDGAEIRPMHRLE